MFDQVVDVFAVEVLLDQPQVVGRFLFHLVLEEQLEQLEVFNDGIDLFAVEGEGFLKLVEDADEIEHEAAGFTIYSASFS